MIDFKSKDFKFISKKDNYFIGETKLESEFENYDVILTYNKRIEELSGMFRGMTMDSYVGYVGDLPREKTDSCGFDEFEIYYKDVIVNERLYLDLEKIIIQDIREDKINKVLNEENN